jgi:hypothetical protein
MVIIAFTVVIVIVGLGEFGESRLVRSVRSCLEFGDRTRRDRTRSDYPSYLHLEWTDTATPSIGRAGMTIL